MIDMLKRHEIQVLRRAGHTWMEVAALSGVSVRTARRVAEEAAVTAEVMGTREPTRARAALERYVARLRALPAPTRAEQADLVDAERQLARLAGGPR